MIDERELAIHPIASDSLQHNAKTLSNIRALTASLFGVAAGTLGLESYAGFLFYLVGTVVVSALLYVRITMLDGAGPIAGQDKAAATPAKFFYRPMLDLWTGDVVGNMMGYILTWTLFYNLVRA